MTDNQRDALAAILSSIDDHEDWEPAPGGLQRSTNYCISRRDRLLSDDAALQFLGRSVGLAAKFISKALEFMCDTGEGFHK